MKRKPARAIARREVGKGRTDRRAAECVRVKKKTKETKESKAESSRRCRHG